ncbi:hypothetical protein ACQJBY_046367 [Aegilops geniculata]
MLPGAVVVGAAGGGAPGHVRAAARAALLLGLAVAAMGLFAATINPGDFHAQVPTSQLQFSPTSFHQHLLINLLATQSLVEHAAAPAAYGGQPQQQCAATEAEALDLRATALMLALTGSGQAMLAAAAGVALAGSLPLECFGRLLAVIAHIFGAVNACFLYSVVQGAAVVVLGHCAGGYHLNFVISCVFAAVSYIVLFFVSFSVTLCG